MKSAEMVFGSSQSHTVIHWLKLNRVDKVRALMAAGHDLNAHDENGWTLLSAAADHESPEICRDLILLGADIDQADRSGRTPLAWAITNDDEMTCALLVAYGAIATGSSEYPDHIKRVISLPRVHAALLTGKLEILKDLLDAGVSPEHQMPGHQTAIEYANSLSSLPSQEAMADYLRSWTARALADQLLSG